MAGLQSRTVISFIPLVIALSVLMAASFESARGDGVDSPSMPALSDRGLEELLNIEVTTVAKHGQKLTDSAAAVYVITQDDIRRTGATSIAEALRMVPGMQVGQVTSSKWAVGARGFCDLLSNKLLVLIDGRSVYSPLLAGVFWDAQDTMMEDIDRIEVVRGPGATLWGANAVNGVVNVVTKSSSDTQGMLLSLGGASSGQNRIEGVRAGGTIGAKTHFRVYAKGFFDNGMQDSRGVELGDQWQQSRVGFRLDSNVSDRDSFTLQGDTYSGSGHAQYDYGTATAPYIQTYFSDTTASGWNTILRWNRSELDNTRSTLQVYIDEARRYDPFLFREDTRTIDVDYQREVHPGATSTVVWGIGGRRTETLCEDGYTVAFGFSKAVDYLYSAFAQTDHTLIPDRLRLILGGKLEHNDYTGIEFQPNARAVWTPNSKSTVWGSMSQAVRTPSIADFDSLYHVTAPPDALGKPRVVTIFSNPGMQSEKLTAYELGYRVQPLNNVSLDIAAYSNFYDDLRSVEPSAPFIHYENGEHRHTPFYVSNNFTGNSRGLEVSGDWVVTPKWRIKASSNSMGLWLDRSRSFDITGANLENTYPQRLYSLISYWDIPGDVEFDVMFYRAEGCETPVLADLGVPIPSYSRLDVRMAFKGRDKSEWAFGIQNALDSKHLEAGSVYGEPSTYIGRSYYFKTTHRF